MSMRVLGRIILIVFFGLINTSFSENQGYNINVKFTELRNSKGRIQLQIYRNQETFKKETPWKKIFIPKSDVKNNTLQYKISGIPEGTYGIAILDDENSNDEMDYSFMMPKEGFGFSDYFHTSWSRPKFEDFKFFLKEDKNVTIKVRYV
jgi:uncharacterized protein (DUF2141 family)